FLASMHCDVRIASSAEQALADLAEGAVPDLMLTDIALGAGMRGTELARRATALFPRLAVLLMSGYSKELLDAADGHLPSWPLLRKPYTRDELRAAIVDALRG